MGADFGNVTDEKSAEFYSPPYLFKGARPSITQAPAQISYNTNFSISTPDATSIATAVLIRTGAVTHFFDQNTRYVPLSFTQASGGSTLSAPACQRTVPTQWLDRSRGDTAFMANRIAEPAVPGFRRHGQVRDRLGCPRGGVSSPGKW